jgi:ApaG protein
VNLTSIPKVVSEAVTEGVRVRVRSQYLPERSSVPNRQYAFAYTIRISNESSRTVQLRARHWIITHGDGHMEEVRGPGVVGEQPLLKTGDSFEYTSGCVLGTSRGSMKGTYLMVTPDGEAFEATIAEFALELPHTLN